MLRILLVAALMTPPLTSFAQQPTPSKGLAGLIATLDALDQRCAQYYAINKPHSYRIIELAYKEGNDLFSEAYFGEVVVREMVDLSKQIDAIGERSWCFEVRGQMRRRSENLFPSDAPTR